MKNAKLFRTVFSALAIIITIGGAILFALFYKNATVDLLTPSILLISVICSLLCYVANLVYCCNSDGNRVKASAKVVIPSLLIGAIFLFVFCADRYAHDTFFYELSIMVMDALFIYIGNLYTSVIDVETIVETEYE